MTQKRLILLQAIASFSLGAGLFFLIILSFRFFPDLRLFYGATSWGPWVEEGLKFGGVLLLIRLIYLKPVVIPFLGAGFGLMEAITRFSAFEVRSMLLYCVHFIFGLVMAYFFYLATNPKYLSFRSIWYSFALLIPVYLHLLYNIVVKA